MDTRRCASTSPKTVPASASASLRAGRPKAPAFRPERPRRQAPDGLKCPDPAPHRRFGNGPKTLFLPRRPPCGASPLARGCPVACPAKPSCAESRRGTRNHGTDAHTASAPGGEPDRGRHDRGAVGRHPARARRTGGEDTRRRSARLRRRKLPRDAEGDTPASSKAGRRLVGTYGARISHTYGTVLNGFAVEADERQARRLAADPHVASVVQDSRVTLDVVGKNPPSWGWTASTSRAGRWTATTAGRSPRAPVSRCT